MNTKTLALNRRFTYGQVNVVANAGLEPANVELFLQVFIKRDSIFLLQIMKFTMAICTQNYAFSDFFFYVWHIVAIGNISRHSTLFCARIDMVKIKHIRSTIATFCAPDRRFHFVYLVFALCIRIGNVFFVTRFTFCSKFSILSTRIKFG